MFQGVTNDDQLVYVNNVLKGKLLESETLVQQAGQNSKPRFSVSPDLERALDDAIIDALEAHTAMSRQALDSPGIRARLKDVLLGPGELYEALRSKGGFSEGASP